MRSKIKHRGEPKTEGLMRQKLEGNEKISLIRNINELVRLGIKALRNAYKIHEELGERGLQPVEKNEYGDTSLLVDIKAEEAVINTFKEADVPLRVISEEHGWVDLSREPEFLAVLDGLDGTNVYKKARGKGRYGTMFGIFSSLNPTYSDYIFSGIMEHSFNRLYYAVKNKGGFLIENGKKRPLKCSSIKELNNARIYVDRFFDKDRGVSFIYDTFISKLKDYPLLHANSSAIHYADLANGEVDLVLECTRKGNLEIAVAYGLIREAGGVMVAKDGTDIGSKMYLSFGQDKYIPIISASTMKLANELIEKLD